MSVKLKAVVLCWFYFYQSGALGVWEFRSKSREEVSCLKGGCRGYMFALEVVEELEEWPEQGDKSRKWVSYCY